MHVHQTLVEKTEKQIHKFSDFSFSSSVPSYGKTAFTGVNFYKMLCVLFLRLGTKLEASLWRLWRLSQQRFDLVSTNNKNPKLSSIFSFFSCCVFKPITQSDRPNQTDGFDWFGFFSTFFFFVIGLNLNKTKVYGLITVCNIQNHQFN